MAIKPTIFVDDAGKIFELQFDDYKEVDGELIYVGPLDISTATEITFIFEKPDRTTTVSKTMTVGGDVVFSTDGLDGLARYVSEADFLDVFGTWRLQGFAEFSASAKHYSRISEFVVKEHL